MQQQTILMICFGSRGDNVPAILLGTALQNRGFRVAFITTQDHQPLLERAGLHDYILAPTSMQDMLRGVPQLVAASGNILKFLREASDKLLLPAIKGLLDATREGIERYRPEVVVMNAVADFMVRQVVSHYGLRTIRLDPYHLADPALGEARILPLVMPSVFPAWVPTAAFTQSHRLFDGVMWRLIGETSYQLTSQMFDNGHKRITFREARSADLLRIYAVSQYLLVGDRRIHLPANVHLAGFFYPPVSGTGLAEDVEVFIQRNRAAGRPVLGACFGSMYLNPRETTDIVVQAARRVGAAVILIGASGELVEDETVWQAADDDMMYVQEIPFVDLLPRLDGAITHAGSGTTAHLVLSGIGFVGVTYVVDQARWVDLARAHGVCPPAISRTNLTVDRLVEALRVVLAQQTRQNARTLATRIERDGVQRSADFMVGVLENGRDSVFGAGR